MFNITVNQVSLLAAIKRVSPAVPVRHVMPIMTSIKLSASGAVLTLIGTDLDHSVETRIEAQISGPGAVVINAKLLAAAVKALSIAKDKSAMVHLEKTGESAVKVSCNGVTQSLETLGSADDYPNLPVCESPVVSLTGEQVQTIIGMEFATDQRKTLSLLECVNLQINGKLDVCATDGSRLVHFADALPLTGSQATVNANIPNVAINVLSKALDKKANNIVVAGKFSMFGDRCEYLQFTDGGSGSHNTTVICRLNASEYPRYAQLFPSKQAEATITYDRLALLSAARAGAKLNKTQLIKLTGGHVAASNESQSFSVNIESRAYADHDLPTIGVNGKYLADWLESITDKQVTLELSGSLKPTKRIDYKGKEVVEIPATLKPIIMRDSTRDMRYLLMPVPCK